MCSFKWATLGHAAGQRMVFAFAVLNRMDHFMQVCPKWGLNLVLTAYGIAFVHEI